MKKLQRDLEAITKRLAALAEKTKGLGAALAEMEKAAPVKKVRAIKRKTAAPKAAKSKAAPKKEKKVTDADQVLLVMKRAKKGVDVAKLKEKTGFNDKKISNIVHRAYKKGVIKRVGRGLYSLTE